MARLGREVDSVIVLIGGASAVLVHALDTSGEVGYVLVVHYRPKMKVQGSEMVVLPKTD